jgi:regulator of RNase E activity RraA
MNKYLGGCVLIIAMAAGVNGNTVHVPADRPTIQAGIDFAAPGDIVLVAAGVYLENINFHGKAITVTSEQGAGLTVIDGQGQGSVTTFATGEGLAARGEKVVKM